jgi:hypothetical protein
MIIANATEGTDGVSLKRKTMTSITIAVSFSSKHSSLESAEHVAEVSTTVGYVAHYAT